MVVSCFILQFVVGVCPLVLEMLVSGLPLCGLGLFLGEEEQLSAHEGEMQLL